MLHMVLDNLVKNSQVCVIYFNDDTKIVIDKKKSIPYIEHVGEQYIAIRTDSNSVFYMLNSIFKIECW